MSERIYKKCIVCGKEFLGGNNSKYCSEECRKCKIPTKDHVGEKHHELTIKSAYREKSKLYAVCECSCGNTCTVRYDRLLSGHTKSCGHVGEEKQFKSIDLYQKVNKYGIKAIRETEEIKWNCHVWEVQCHCGKVFRVGADKFYKIKSCGCSQYKNGVKNVTEANERYNVENTRVLNLMHKKLAKNNTSGVTGVTFRKQRGTWAAQIEFKGVSYYLGSYHKKEDAIEARKTAEKELHGSFLEWYAKEHPESWKKLNKKNN